MFCDGWLPGGATLPTFGLDLTSASSYAVLSFDSTAFVVLAIRVVSSELTILPTLQATDLVLMADSLRKLLDLSLGLSNDSDGRWADIQVYNF